MTAIQSVRILGHEERSDPKLHVVYKIEVQASVRSWLMWRRYSEFDDLNTELSRVTGAPPPHPLPPKHKFAVFRAKDNPETIKEREEGLEIYLRAIVSSRDDRWRESYEFKNFLGIPITRRDGVEGGAPLLFTSSTWLDEHTELKNLVADIRADVNKRDTFLDRGDTSSAHETNVQGKKKLVTVLNRLDNLTRGLTSLAKDGMSTGELQRRTEMSARLQDDCEKLSKMLVISRASTARTFAAGFSGSRVPASDKARADLFDAPASATSAGGGSKPFARVFGAQTPPQETEQTRPLDDAGVYMLQQDKMKDQDSYAAQLTTILTRQKQLGLAINQEIQEQTEMLEDLDREVDAVGGRLQKAQQQLKRIDR